MRSSDLVHALWLCALLLLAACGEEQSGAGAPTADGDARPPVQADPGALEVQTSADLLARLQHRLRSREGLTGRAFGEDVRRVAEVLWPADAAGRVPEAGRVHTLLAGIAGSTAPYILRDDEEGARYLRENPEDAVVHAAYLAIVSEGPERYRAWCETEGAGVLATWQASRRTRLLGD